MIEIITPCSRPENLSKLAKCMNASTIWHICFDSLKVGAVPVLFNAYISAVRESCWGNPQRNNAIRKVYKDSLVYCLDDDNLLHADFFTALSDHDLSDYDIITFDQLLEDGTIRKGNNPTRTNIDQAQFLIRKSIHEPYEQEHDADGILIEKLVKKYPDKWLYIPKVLCYYNRLKWQD